MDCIIYALRCKINNKRYVGSSINYKHRRKDHLQALNRGRHSNTYLQKAWNKHGSNNFRFEVLEICSNAIRNLREQYWMKRPEHIEMLRNNAKSFREDPEKRAKNTERLVAQNKSKKHRAFVRKSAKQQWASMSIEERSEQGRRISEGIQKGAIARLIPLICDYCKVTFFVSGKSKQRNRKYCCHQCYLNYMRFNGGPPRFQPRKPPKFSLKGLAAIREAVIASNKRRAKSYAI